MYQGYQKDLAYIHDDGFGGFARQAAKEILRIFHQATINEGLVVDLGCGSGIWASILLENGYQAHGIDISPAMIELARQRAPQATFQQASFLKAEIPPCSAVTSMGECLNYLFDKDNSDKILTSLFSRIFDALLPGGLFIFDVIGPGYMEATRPNKRHFFTDDWAVMVHISKHHRDETLTRYITSFRKTENGLYERHEEAHKIRLLSGKHLASLLREAGFKVRIRKNYGSFKLTSAHSVLIARKP